MTSDKNRWQAVTEYDANKQFERILPFKNHVVLYGRADGRESIWISSNES
jgi:protease II